MIEDEKVSNIIEIHETSSMVRSAYRLIEGGRTVLPLII